MSKEERWQQRREWELERGEIEIKFKEDITGSGDVCQVPKCGAEAVAYYVIGSIGHHGGLDIYLCKDHDSNDQAYETYDKEARS